MLVVPECVRLSTELFAHDYCAELLRVSVMRGIAKRALTTPSIGNTRKASEDS